MNAITKELQKKTYDNCLVLANDIRKISSLSELPKEIVDDAYLFNHQNLEEINTLFLKHCRRIAYADIVNYDLILMQISRNACIGTFLDNSIIYLGSIGCEIDYKNRLSKFILGCYRFNG
jgi:hypothetical protein